MIATAASLFRRFPWDLWLLRSAAIVFAGQAIARLLGFLFYVAAARLLEPADWGLLAYALAILATASILLTNSPAGLARFLARHVDNRQRQEIYFSNWVAVVVVMLVGSIVAFLPFARLTGLTGWLLLGVIVNLANIAVFETYLQAQRGLGRFTTMMAYYVLANFLQLMAILMAGALGLRSTALFLVIYGVSAIAALVLMQAVAPTPLRFQFATVAWRRMIRIARYILPVIVQGIFYAVWSAADLILVEHLLDSVAEGNYAAAKTLTQVLIMAPTAISTTASTRVARLPESAVRNYLLRLLALTAAASLPIAAGMVLLQGPFSFLFFGSKYPHVVDGLSALIVGMTLYSFYLVMASTWGGLGRPAIGALASGVGTAATIGLAFLLIPNLLLLGAGIAFAAGASVQLVAISLYTLWGLYSGAAPRVRHLPDEAIVTLGDA